MNALKYDSNRHTVSALLHLYKKGVLKLEPTFQRQSVWNMRQRIKLLESVFRGYPIPSIFLYKHLETDTGQTIFEVVDGKQRLESLFRYMGTPRQRFAAPLQLLDWEHPEPTNWTRLQKLRQQRLVEEYCLNVTEVEGDLPDIIELFVRLNSTGNALTPQEIRNAKFYRSEFLKTSRRLAARYESYLQGIGVIGAQQVRRMKHIELLAELLYAASIEGIGNKKRVIDTAMNADSLKGSKLRKSEQAVVSSLNHVKRMFPDLSRSVRFHKISDFYSLVLLIQSMERERFILGDKVRVRLAWKILVALSTGVDELSLKSKKLEFKTLSPREELFRQYLQTVKEGVDSEGNRRKRHELLSGLLQPIFERKDANRLFSPEQRRILWNTAEERVCAECGCVLTWRDFHADHIKPFSLGGKTSLENAALLCVKHNLIKGKRSRKAA